MEQIIFCVMAAEPIPTYHDASYFCDKCKKNRRLKLNVEKHENFLVTSQNGLVVYSDIHPCKEGLYEVNNLNIDKNYHIRSFEFLKLPEYRKKTKSMIPMPGMNKAEDDSEIIKIMEIDSEGGLNIVLDDQMLKSTIKIGRFDHQTEPLHTIESDLMAITLHYYKSEIPYSVELENWLQFMINTLEILPPTKLGMLIETIKYVLDQHKHPPSDFDKKFIKTILASHEIFFHIEELANVMNLYEKYSDHFNPDDFEFIDHFLSTMQNNPNMPIQYFTSQVGKDLVYQIYLFLILEKEKIIAIERPGIVEFI